MFSILIVDDNTTRSEKLLQRISSELSLLRDSIDFAASTMEAKLLLRAKKYDVALIDLGLPKRKGETPTADGGLTLIKAIETDKKIRTPTKLLGMTEFAERKNDYHQEFANRCFHIAHTEFNGNDWMDSILKAITHSYRSYLESLDDTNSCVIKIHGIRTYGDWQESLGKLIKENLKSCEPLSYQYGVFSVFAFMIPWLRDREVRRFCRHIEANKNLIANKDLNFVAHSFGTYILIRALEKYSVFEEYRISTIILAGSVLDSKYDWGEILSKYSFRIINDCGTRDLTLCLSQIFVLGTGMAGRNGFASLSGGRITNRFFEGGHSHYFKTPGFMKTYWLDLFSPNKKIKIVDKRRSSALTPLIELLLSLAGHSKPYVYLGTFTLLLVQYFFSQ